MSHPLSSTKFVPCSVLRGLRGVLAVLAVTLATHAFGIAAPSHQTPAAPNLLSAPTAVDIQSCATEDIQLGAEVLPWDELQAHDESQTPQAFPSLTTEKQAYLEAKSASSPIYTGASSYEIKSAQRYEKVTDIASSFKEQTLLHITLSNGQTIQATAGHPFKTLEGWRDAVLLKKGGQLLLGGEADAAERFATILEIREEVKTTAVFNLEVANLHTFFVGVDGVVVHNGNGSYTCTFASGKRYHGKSDRKRAEKSGRDHANDNNDPVVDIDWKPANNKRDSYRDEHKRLRDDGGKSNPDNYNKINSPGAKY